MSEGVLGIDISKGKFDVELRFDDKKLKRKFDNTAKGYRLLDGWLRSLHITKVHACMEATGVYGEPLAEFLYERGHKVSVVNPLRIKKYAESDLKRNKTDTAKVVLEQLPLNDASTTADFCQKKDPEAWHPLPVEVKQLQAFSRRLDAL
jgi:transposase